MDELRVADPQVVGPYRLLKRLGGGGMGQVFLGRSPGGRLVAVKVVRPELAGDADFRRRFVREVEAARQVGGFYTAHVVDADPAADPPWLASAYIPGPSLQQAVSLHGPLPERALGRLAAGLAEGLTAVHRWGMVHRDLKPGNVLLAGDGPRLIDFGIARAAEDTQLTGTGMAIGTPGFMAPEHIIGNQAGPESDVFALGAVLTFAATGRLPFGVGAAHAVNYRVVHEPPDLSGLPPSLGPLVADCLAKETGRRPTLAQLLDQVIVPDTTGASWLPSGMTSMISERDVPAPASVGTFFGGTDPYPAGAGGRSTRRGRRRAREEQERVAERERLRQRGQRWLINAEEVCSHITGVQQRTQALAHLAANVQPGNPARGAFLVVEAHRYAATATDVLAHIQALATIVTALAPTDQARARTAAERAEGLALAIRGRRQRKVREDALLAAAEALAPVEPERAERMARSVEGDDDVLLSVAEGMAAADPDRAERIARELADRQYHEGLIGWTLHGIAEAQAVKDPDRAERLAHELTGKMEQTTIDRLFRDIAAGLARSDPRRAERTVLFIHAAWVRSMALSAIVSALIPVDPEQALRIANGTDDTASSGLAQAELFRQLVRTDPERAERVARSTIGEEPRAESLFELFQQLREERPQQAWRVARSIPADQPRLRAAVLNVLAEDLSEKDPARAEQLVQEAEHIASQISDLEERESTLAHIAKTLACTDPARARAVATSLTETAARADVLRFLALLLKETSPVQAEDLFEEFVRTAREITDPDERQLALVEGVRTSAESEPRWAIKLALETAAQEDEDSGWLLENLTQALVDFVPETAEHIATQAVHTARGVQDKDTPRDTYARLPLTRLALINPRTAARLTMNHQPAEERDELLLDLVYAMVKEACTTDHPA
ncbi:MULTISPECIES: serine/threonine-protein kinase [unclassified Streptomyces]|uniref:serine/threonine-protein kinase n=1 Tax=unclassified Streptomyces TaxID=2593676 RepID=UPI00093FCD16|nr:protein kinase [Streptomyces sp. CB02058]